MPKWSDGYVNSNGLNIHYYRTGGDKPQVVMNHGAADDGLCWTLVAKELENDYDVILPDARGHGKSDSGNGDYTTKQRVADLVGLIQALKLEYPVIGGHSMGANTSLYLAAEYPQMARAIFLEDPPITLPGEALFGTDQRIGKLAERSMKQSMTFFKIMPKFLDLFVFQKLNPSFPDDESIPWVDSKIRLSFDAIQSLSLRSFTHPEPLAVFTKIQVPVLLIIGDKEKMSIVSQDTASLAAQANPLVKVVHLEGANHDIRRTRFDGYVPALKSFLKKVYASQSIEKT